MNPGSTAALPYALLGLADALRVAVMPVQPEPVGGGEAVDGPGETARPGAFRLPALVRAFAFEGAAGKAEDPLVGGAAVRANQIARGLLAVLQRDLSHLLVPGFIRGPEDDADVHHDVDEQRLRADERREIAALLPAQGQRPAGFDQHLAQARIVGQAIPAEIG